MEVICWKRRVYFTTADPLLQGANGFVCNHWWDSTVGLSGRMEDVLFSSGCWKSVVTAVMLCWESFFFPLGEVWGWVHLVRRPLFVLFYRPQMIDDDECGVVGEWELAGETEVCGENMPQFHLVHHKSHMTCPGLEPMLLWWETGDCLSYDTVFVDRVKVLSVWRNILRWSFPAAARLRSHGRIPHTWLQRVVPVVTVSYFRGEL
jgi:hypothetical protein